MVMGNLIQLSLQKLTPKGVPYLRLADLVGLMSTDQTKTTVYYGGIVC